MEECVTSNILNNVIKSSMNVKIQEITSPALHKGIIKESDCLGILFIPEDKNLNKSFIPYTDIRKIMLHD